ncbi:MAG: GAF domain-containing protein [Ardenticatenaceae bacterium]|nr:GAF domain-containing protein [Ardenticatenaceae bacterium]
MSNLGRLPLDDRLTLIVRQAKEILGAECCGIFLAHRPGTLTLEASVGHHPDGFHKGMEIAVHSSPRSGLTGHIAASGELFHAYGTELQQHFAVRGDPPHAASRQCYSLLAIPLLRRWGDQQELLGLLRTDNKLGPDGRPSSNLFFSQEDIWLLRLFADIVVVAIEGAGLVASLNEERDRFARLVASSPNGVVANDQNGFITVFDSQAEMITGYRASEMIGQPVAGVYADPDEASRIGERLRAAPDGRLVGFETAVLNRQNEPVPIRLTVTRLVNAGGEPAGSVGYFEDLRDIQETRRRLELLLSASNVVAQAQNMSEGLQHLTELMASVLELNFCYICILDESNQFLVGQAIAPNSSADHDGPDWSNLLGQKVSVSRFAGVADLLKTGGPVVLQKEEPERRFSLATLLLELGLEEEFQSLLVLPLRAGDNPMGLLYLGDQRPWGDVPFPNERLDLVQAIGEQTAVLVDRMRAYEMRMRRERLLSQLDSASRHIRGELDPEHLDHAILRQAAQLTHCTAAGLAAYQPNQGRLLLEAAYQLPDFLIGSSWSHEIGLIGRAARLSEAVFTNSYQEMSPPDPLLTSLPLQTLAAVPLKRADEVEAILFVADTSDSHWVLAPDMEVLERFAIQAALSRQTARLMGREHRIYARIAMLHRISDNIQATDDVGKIIHVVLTGVTAGYGLGYNRAAIFLLDDTANVLLGQMGIGHFRHEQATQDWEQDMVEGQDDFRRYLARLEHASLPLTPLGRRIEGSKLPLTVDKTNPLNEVLQNGKVEIVYPDQFNRFAPAFLHLFEPTTPIVIIPLLIHDQAIGLLVADNKFTHAPITQDDVELLLTVANSAAVAVDKARLHAETRQARERLQAFYSASNMLAATRDPERIWREIVEQTCQVAQASQVRMLLIEAETGKALELVATGTEHVEQHTAVPEHSVTMQVMRSGHYQIISDLSEADEHTRRIVGEVERHTAVGLPVFTDGQQVGVMWLYYNEPRSFKESEIEALQLYVNQVANAYDNARRLQGLEKMRQAAEDLAGTADLEGVLKQIAHNARRVLNGDLIAIWLYDDERQKFILKESLGDGFAPDIWQNFLQEEPGTQGTAYQVMQVSWIGVTEVGDDNKYPFIPTHTQQLLGRVGVRSFQGIALSVGEEKLGVLYVDYRQNRSFSEEDQITAQTFGNHAALALKKAKLLHNVRKAHDIARVVARVMALDNLDDTLTSIVQGTREVLECDAITLYVYDEERDRFKYPVTSDGLIHPEEVQRYRKEPKGSLIYRMLYRDEFYLAENVPQDEEFGLTRFAREEQIAACVAIPLVVNRSHVGVMFVNYRHAHSFTGDELDNMDLFANQAAVAIQNAQLFERQDRRSNALQALYKASQSMTTTLDVGKIVEQVVAQAWHLVNFEGRQISYASVWLRDTQPNIIRLAATYPSQEMAVTRTAVGDVVDWRMGKNGRVGIIGRVIRSGHTEYVRNVLEDNDYLASHVETRSEVVVPMIVDQEVIGVINVEHGEVGAFAEAEISALETLAAQAAITLKTIRYVHMIERRAAALRSLYEAGQVITGSLSLDRILEQIAEQAYRLMDGSEAASPLGLVTLVHQDELVFKAAFPLQAWEQLQSGVGDAIDLVNGHNGRTGIMARVLRTGITQRIGDVMTDPDYIAYSPHTRSELAVPIKIKGEVFGVINIEHSDPDAFEREDQETLELLAAQAAVAIENARLYEDLKQVKGLVGARTALAWMGMASNAWRHSIEGHAVSIQGAVTLLRMDLAKADGLRRLLPTAVDERLQLIDELAGKILEKPITPPLSSEDGVQPVIINDLISERLDQLWKNEPYQGVAGPLLNLEATADTAVWASPEWVRLALDLLVDNAVQAMQHSRQPALTLSTCLAGEQIEIAIQDTGPGIPLDLQPRLFLEPLDDPQKEGRLGRGLLMVQAIVETFGGDVRLEQTGPEGTIMVVALPRFQVS